MTLERATELLNEASAIVADTQQTTEENQMSAELLKAVSDLADTVSSLVERYDSMEAKVDKAAASAEEARQGAETIAKGTRQTLAKQRLDSLVRAGKIQPVMANALGALISEDADEAKLELFFAEAEKVQPAGNGQLTQEITTVSGAKEMVAIDQRHTLPKGSTGAVMGPNPEILALHHQCMQGATSFEEYRRNCYASAGEPVPGSSGPQFPAN